MKSTKTVTLLAVLITVLVMMTYFSCSKTEPMTAQIPTVTTDVISAITQTTATGGGNVTSGGGITVKARGVCWSTSPTPTTASGKTSDSTGTGTFISHLTGLSPNATYYVRAYATNNLGTAYGEERTFTTQQAIPETVTDIDGNVYHTVAIGSQAWLKENLKAVRYNKGDSIPDVSDDDQWSNLKKGARCNYDKDPLQVGTYGRLYNFFAASDTRNICPVGWHVPTDTEWQTLIDYLGGAAVAGGKLKTTGTLEQGTGLWRQPNLGATNESGFSAIPGGIRGFNAGFSLLSESATFWTSTEQLTLASSREISYKYENAEPHSTNKTEGYSVRCIKDK